MRPVRTVRGLENLGRTRLSRNFFMREFMFSEIAAINGFPNLPDNPDLAVTAGRHLCELLLEPLQATFGRISLRSGYRAPEVNEFGNLHDLSCANTERDRARHIWDQRDAAGHFGAMATIVMPWFVDKLAEGTRWQSLAWWIHDHLPYSELQFFPKLGAFNIAWNEMPVRSIYSWVKPRGLLTRPGYENHEGDHSDQYEGFPQLAKYEAMYVR